MHNPDAMARHVALLCLADLDAISQRYVAEVRRLPGYLTTVVGDDELYRTARQMLGTVFRLIAGESTAEELARVSAEVGRRRATQGVPLDSLLRAVRMDFRFLWEAMRAYVDESDMAAFSTEVVAIWETVETHTVNVHSGYMDEVARTNREVELERAFLLRHLLAGSGDARLRAEAADALGTADRRNLRCGRRVPRPRPPLPRPGDRALPRHAAGHPGRHRVLHHRHLRRTGPEVGGRRSRPCPRASRRRPTGSRCCRPCGQWPASWDGWSGRGPRPRPSSAPGTGSWRSGWGRWPNPLPGNG